MKLHSLALEESTVERIPLQARLKKEAFRKIAYAQDLVVSQVYAVFDKAVLHGGTAIWRCYNGRRFSEDLDFYLPKDKKRIDLLFSKLEGIGFTIIKKKVSDSSIFSELEIDRTRVRLEATFQKIAGVICDYEQSDGNIISVYSLLPDVFMAEKATTYLKRLKIRDLWDVFFLLNDTQKIGKIREIGLLLKNYEKPADESDLKAIILEGIVPSSEQMIDYIRRKWEKQNT
jgi:predicted nucleotidyltransferase component of viral defense system